MIKRDNITDHERLQRHAFQLEPPPFAPTLVGAYAALKLDDVSDAMRFAQLHAALLDGRWTALEAAMAENVQRAAQERADRERADRERTDREREMLQLRNENLKLQGQNMQLAETARQNKRKHIQQMVQLKKQRTLGESDTARLLWPEQFLEEVRKNATVASDLQRMFDMIERRIGDAS